LIARWLFNGRGEYVVLGLRVYARPCWMALYHAHGASRNARARTSGRMWRRALSAGVRSMGDLRSRTTGAQVRASLLRATPALGWWL